MKTFRSRVVNGCLLILICALMNHLTAQSTNSSHFSDLLKGSRVTFVGNSLFEQAQSYGTLEYMLINAWPDKNLTFRNLGWSGDTAEGSARSYISTPPQPYELLIQQIEATNPDVVVVAYGSIEAYQGERGLKAFEENLNRLIDTIQGMEAQIVLMSPIPQIPIDGLNLSLIHI